MSLKISNSFLSGTALRCMPLHHTNPGLRPGLTENGSALRNNTPALDDVADLTARVVTIPLLWMMLQT